MCVSVVCFCVCEYMYVWCGMCVHLGVVCMCVREKGVNICVCY